jgi:hypothetical protein
VVSTAPGAGSRPPFAHAVAPATALIVNENKNKKCLNRIVCRWWTYGAAAQALGANRSHLSGN